MQSNYDARLDGLYTTLADLISINSVNPHYPGGPGESAVADYVAEFLKKNRIPFEIQPVFDGRPNVIAKLDGPAGAPTLILEAHTDTASELGMSIDPFRPLIKDNRVYGRGSCDVKGGLAAMMHALKTLTDSSSRPRPSVYFVAAADEEHAFRGVVKFLEKFAVDGQGAAGAIVAEPTNLEIAIASKGVLRWCIHAHGRAAHSSNPGLGINAVMKMAKLLVAMEDQLPAILSRRQHPLLGSSTLSVGIIRGGLQINQVPASCTIDVDYRMLPGEDRATVWSEFNRIIASLRAQDPNFEIEMESPMLEDLPLDTASTERMVEVLSQVSGELTGRSRPVGVPFGSDASKFSRAGIPSVILGPGSIDQAHAAEEFVELEQVALATEIYARTLMALGSTQ